MSRKIVPRPAWCVQVASFASVHRGSSHVGRYSDKPEGEMERGDEGWPGGRGRSLGGLVWRYVLGGIVRSLWGEGRCMTLAVDVSGKGESR